jgi:hypothetical protein
MRQEVETGKSARGRALSEEEISQRLAKLQRRVVFLPLRFRQAELARLNEIERRFVGHLAAVVSTVNEHTTAALEPLVARAEGRIPPRREGQTATERKQEIDQALLAGRALREERKALVEEERAQKAASRGTKQAGQASDKPPAKRRKPAPAPRGFWPQEQE